MIFQEVKNCFIKRQLAEVDTKTYELFLNEAYNIIKEYGYGVELPQDYIELRDLVYTRVAKNIIYQNTKYLNDHFCVGAIYGMLRIIDDQTEGDKEWYDVYNRCLEG